jgi:hypothetical protein
MAVSVTPVTRHQSQRLLGVPLLHEHHRVLEVGREVAEGKWGHVVHRRRHQVDRVAARLDVIAQQVAAEDLHPGLGVERRERALDRLGATRRARCVLHELPGDPVGRGTIGAAGQQGVEGGEAGDGAGRVCRGRRSWRADGDAPGFGHAALIGRCVGHGGEPLVRHQRLGAGVSEDVRDLGDRQVAVEGDEVPPGLEEGHEHHDDLGPIGQQGRHRVTRLQAPVPQGVHELVGPCRDFAGCPLPAVRVDDGGAVRLGCRGGPEASHLRWAHRGSPSTCSPTMFLLISVVPPAMEAWRTASRFSPHRSDPTRASRPIRSTAKAASS